MRGKFTHYLITRFNVSVKNWNLDKLGQPTLSDEWMHDRIALFTRFCLPTILAQKNDSFQWIVYCDRNTPVHFLDQLHLLLQDTPVSSLRLVEDFESMMHDLRSTLSGASTPYVITSRVDNDDGLGQTYIATIQDNFMPVDKTLLNLTGGVLYDQQDRILTRVTNSRLNHYGSLIEARKDDAANLSVLGFPHDNPPADITVQDIHSPFAWLKIIHDRNLKSRTYGRPLVSKEVLRHFGITPSSVKYSLLNTCIYFCKKSLAVLRRKSIRPAP